jgi:hypothetical protein
MVTLFYVMLIILGYLFGLKKWHGVMLASCKRHVSIIFMVTLFYVMIIILGYLFGLKNGVASC